VSSPQLNQVPFRRPDGDTGFLPGMNSNAHPMQLQPGQYARSMNTVNRGGIVQCRPGRRCKFVCPPGNFQGSEWFVPRQGTRVILFAVEGLVYISEAPFTSYRQIPGVAFLPSAREVFFKQVQQSVELNPDGSLTLIDPRELMVMQDGGFTPPAVFDGTTATHQRGPNAIPLGGPMEWVGDRLWVSRDIFLFASDIANPVAFTEAIYFATVRAFTLPGPITALHKTTNPTSPQLLVYTDHTTSLFLASIRDRSQWPTTRDFQQVVLSSIGCTSNRSVGAHYGMLWWWSEHGLVSFDAAGLNFITASLPYRDSEMNDSKGQLSEDLGGVAVASVENYLLVSVPHSDIYNRHTWVLDTGAYQTLNEMAPPVWNSFWTGTRPITWLVGQVNDTNAVFAFSKDYDGLVRLWEEFTPDRLDDGCHITWYMETRGYFNQDPTIKKQFRFAKVFMSELLGTIDVAVFWAGAQRGKYKRILTKRINATAGMLRALDIVTAEDILYALKKQSRELKTQDAKEIWTNETLTSCGVEDAKAEFIDESFQLLIVVSGPGAVNSVLTYTDPVEGEKLGGACEEDEAEQKLVRFDGAGDSSLEFLEAADRLAAEIEIFRSNQSVTLTEDGFIETGIGEAESTISQATADKVAECIATRKAAKRLEEELPAIVSLPEEAL
jgi:hypothetical protein